MTVSASDVVTQFAGTFDGKALTFYHIGDSAAGFNPNDPNPGQNTLHGVPNTGGADYIFDDYFGYNAATATNGPGVDVDGILASTGAGKNKVFYDISLDSSGATQTDFFSITSSGSYVFDDGTFTVSPHVKATASLAQSMASFGSSESAPHAGVRFEGVSSASSLMIAAR